MRLNSGHLLMQTCGSVFYVVCNVGNEYISCDVCPGPLRVSIPNCLCLSLRFLYYSLRLMLMVVVQQIKISKNCAIDKEIKAK